MTALILEFPRKRTAEDIVHEMQMLSINWELTGIEMMHRKLQLLRELDDMGEL